MTSHDYTNMMFSLDDFAHLKIPLQDILSATNNFSDKNFWGQADFGNHYKGQLMWSGEVIDIHAQRWNKEWDEKEQQFWMEISMFSTLRHKNLVSLVGFCDENGEKIIIIKLEAYGSLDNYLSDTMMLTWLRRLEICVGVAHTLSYIHYDESRDFSVIHQNIESETILLNDNYEPKLSEFRLSMKVTASERHLSFDTSNVLNRLGYTDPTCLETKSVNHKSDIYSFGIVMFELLCGRKAVINDDRDNKYLPSLAVTHYREKKLNEIIDFDLRKQMYSQSFDIFAETAFDCLNEERSERPNIDEIVTRLEKALELQLEHHNAIMCSRIQDHAHLKIPLESILSATNNFDENNVVARGGYEKRYRGQLSWSGELIEITARRFNTDRDEMFWTEVSMLSSLKHQNLVSLVGFCDENGEKIIITRSGKMRSLGLHLSDTMWLTWVQRLKISVGLARALSYIHYDEPRDFSVIHRDISSFTVLLNDNCEPKLSCFEKSVRIETSQRHNSFHSNRVWSTNGYTDPTYEKTKLVNHKTDMYSFGIVLLELLCGRQAVFYDNRNNQYLAQLAILHYKEKKLHEIIEWNMWKQMGPQSFDVFAHTAYECLNEEQSQRPSIDEIVTRLETALKLELEHQNTMMSSRIHDLAHLKIPLDSIRSATNNFGDENVVCRGGYENRYRGQLSWSGELIEITARRFYTNTDEMFWTEVSMISSLKHQNLVSLVGFCDENGEKVIIIRSEMKRWLSYYLRDAKLLTWVQRLKISVGLAHALSYIHYDEPRDFSVIHPYISSFTVLLNDNYEPKLCCFENSLKIEASQRHHSFHFDRVWSTNGYTDPTYVKTKLVNHKTDMYSFGIVLFELLCGREAVIYDLRDIQYLAPLAILHYKEKKLNEIIDWNLWKQMDPQSFDVFTEIAYGCLNEEQSQRPSIDEIVTRLEKALKLQLKHQNAINSSPKDNLAHLKIPLESILSATNNFAEENIIWNRRFAKEYKGNLLWYGELINITARRLNKERDDEDEQFWMEIFMLSSLKHKNVVSLVGFCDENDEKVVITRYEARGRLKHHLSDPMRLTWVRRLEICVGLAHALSYIHHEESRDFSVIHQNISCDTVQLNDDWEPKLSYFEHSMKIEASQRHLSFHTNKLEYVTGYGDPTYIETNSVNHRSDMYSFGIVLFELLCGRNSIIYHGDDLAPLAKTHYRKKTLDYIICNDLQRQMDLHSFNMFADIAYDCLDDNRSRRPNIIDIVPRLEKALELARENRPIHSSPNHLAHLRIPLEDIKSTTNYFAEENLIGKGGFKQRYKGQLSWSSELINIDAQRVSSEEWDDEKEQQFWTEISMLFSLKHKNLVSVVGFCNEVGAETIIYKHEIIRGRLDDYLSDPMLLRWVKRLEICVGIVHALSYIHYDESRDFSVIHRNISSYTILLNDDWEPKLSEFQHSMKIKASERHHSFHTDSVWSTKGYTDPTCLETKSVNHKSDIYSFGIVLFELLCGRKSVSDDQDNKYLAPAAVFHYKEKTLDDIIDPDLLKQMDLESFNIFSETAYNCLNEEQSQCPNIYEIVTRLEKALELQLERENVEHSVAAAEIEGTSFNHEKGSVTFASTGNESHLTDTDYCLGR